MQTFRCVIVDDEPLAVSLLVGYAEKTPSLVLGKTFTNPIEALHHIHEHGADVVFLDVQMPELNGIQLMKILGDKTRVILTTAYPEFALDGFEHDAIDYLLKPISFERFQAAVEKMKSRVLPNTVAIPTPDYIFVKSEHRLLKIMLSEILYFEGLRDYVAIHVAGKKKILTLQSMKSFEESLPAPRFMRIHKSYLISMDKIEFIERSRVYIAGNPLPVGDGYKEQLMLRIGN
jgi:two-component system LytT family response regulator